MMSDYEKGIILNSFKFLIKSTPISLKSMQPEIIGVIQNLCILNIYTFADIDDITSLTLCLLVSSNDFLSIKILNNLLQRA